ncbi:MBL fold metallo-hydrolase [Aestuariibius sp. 2305UL40-4]|uniref:MBL fold metallo-hydrolase n=1 Tax=Aestuariibius violaceus TaxID=3234132 RepID=UPI00345EEB93
MTDLPKLQGRVTSLAILDYGLFEVREDERRIGLPGYLIRTDAGEAILVDLGLPPKYIADPEGAGQGDGLDAFGRVVSVTEANSPAAQLALLGLTAADIDLLVLTHSHIDHIGDLAFAPQAPLLLSAAERALDRPVYWQTAQPLAWPDRKTVTITGDTELCPGLTLLDAPGHTPGQLALWLDLPETGPVLLTSDAISRPGEAFATEAASKTAANLLARAKAAGAFVIYGHWQDQWPRLRKAPDLYC